MQLHRYSKVEIQSLLSLRAGEAKLGEHIGVFTDDVPGPAEDFLMKSPAPFVLLGVQEDVGIRANGGVGGADTAWPAFLKSFLNIQSNSFLSGDEILLLGAVKFYSGHIDTDSLRVDVSKLDAVVRPYIELIVKCGKVPVVIGGGHNNCYPVIAGCSAALGQAINTINLDAHADYRVKEGRHSGNGFRYAAEEGFLKKYAMLGLHEAYNNRVIIDEIARNENLKAVWVEDFFIRNKAGWQSALKECMDFVNNDLFGVELDMDSIENVLSSAMSPVGVSMQQALEYLHHCGTHANSIYLHLPEAVASRADGLTDTLCGKRLSYLVQAFIKGKLSAKNYN